MNQIFLTVQYLLNKTNQRSAAHQRHCISTINKPNILEYEIQNIFGRPAIHHETRGAYHPGTILHKSETRQESKEKEIRVMLACILSLFSMFYNIYVCRF